MGLPRALRVLAVQAGGPGLRAFRSSSGRAHAAAAGALLKGSLCAHTSRALLAAQLNAPPGASKAYRVGEIG